MRRIFQIQRTAFRQDAIPDQKLRQDRLGRLAHLIRRHERDFLDAISADFGHRSPDETRLAECLPLLGALRHARRNLGRWMQTRRLPTALPFRPGRNLLVRQPLGVVGIAAPWTYPLLHSLGPAVAALAAGNRVMIKPSELTPGFARLLAELVAQAFDAAELAVIPGSAEQTQAFIELPFDHLLFHGSARTGRLVAETAARNLTPITLELGGKSPAIIDASANPAKAARRLARGKLMNAGQSNVAPDYVLVPRGTEDYVAEALRRAIRRLYPRLAANPDYTSIISDSHFARLDDLLDDARAKGATVIQINPGKETFDPLVRKFPPTLVLGATGDMRLMQEEICGPILPILPFDDLRDVIAGLAQCDRPLALYWFGEDVGRRDRIVQDTISGSVAINDCLWQATQHGVPFGGVGASGWGATHGEHGFITFSKEKAVFLQARRSGLTLLYRPTACGSA